MTGNRISSRREAEKWLHAACERCIGYLSELNAIHLAIDGPERAAATSEAEFVLHLRKAYFHVQAITSWTVATDVLHVMGPDIRAASEHLAPVVVRHLYGDDKAGLEKRRGHVAKQKRRLVRLSHPTSVILIQPRHLGGFGKTDTIVCLSTLYQFLMGLVADYGFGLGLVADVLEPSRQPDILDVTNRANAELASVSPDALLRFVEASE